MSTKAPNMMKPLVLAVVLCGLGGFAYWLEYSKKPKEAQAEADGKKLFVLKDRPVTRLEFFGPSMKPENAAKPPLAVTLDCTSLAEKLCKTDDASHWQLATPLKTKADDSTVNSLLKNFGNLVSNETIDLGVESPEKRASLLKDYGLDAAARANPATRRVSVTVEGGTRFVAYFGVKHPIGDNVFTLLQSGDAVNENKVYIVPDWQLSVFDQKTSYFRDKNLFGLNAQEITDFTLAVSKKVKGTLVAKRAVEGKGWNLKLGATDVEGDVDTVDGILSGVTHLAAKDVVSEKHDSPDAKKALAGSKPSYDLKFSGAVFSKHLRFFEKKKNPKDAAATVYAIVDDQDPLYEVDVYGADKIEKTFDEMRIGKMLSVTERYSITAIDVENHGAEAHKQHIEKESGGQWMIGGTPAGRGKIEALLDRLSSKIVTTYAGPAPTGGVLKMIFRKKSEGKDAVVAEIEFWSPNGHLYARNLRSPKKEIVELAPDFNTSLPWKATTLFDAAKGP
jgi:hypothetical protein